MYSQNCHIYQRIRLHHAQLVILLIPGVLHVLSNCVFLPSSDYGCVSN